MPEHFRLMANPLSEALLFNRIEHQRIDLLAATDIQGLAKHRRGEVRLDAPHLLTKPVTDGRERITLRELDSQ
jgi:hypothetical protein